MTAKRIYVAGGSSERLMVRSYIERLRTAGWEVTHDWTRDAGYDAPSTTEQSRRSAAADLCAVSTADVVWVIAPADKSEGAGVEFGYAFASGKRTIVSGPHRTRCIFHLIAHLIFDKHEDAFQLLRGAT